MTEQDEPGLAGWQLMLRPSSDVNPIPYGLLSLWDMQKLYAQYCLDLGRRISEAFIIFQVAEGYDHGDKNRELDDGEISLLKNLLTDIKCLCMKIPLRHSYDVLKLSIEDPPQTFREFQKLVVSIEIEMKGIFFFSIPQHRIAYFEHTALLKPGTRQAFPQLTQEIWNGGNCYALGLSTACVFHCMRALEHALKALADGVGQTWASEQWHTIIESIEAKIKALRGSKKSAQRDEELNFLSQAAKEFMYFKDGWRNYVSHNKIIYEEGQAQKILEHVASFADILATKLKERPDPIHVGTTQ